MASLSRAKSGLRTLHVVCPDGVRRKIHLGRMPLRAAEQFRVRVEQIVACTRVAGGLPDECARWLNEIDPAVYARLANARLVEERRLIGLKDWLADCIKAKRASGLKPSSIRKLEQTAGLLRGYFAGNRSIRTITPDDAAAWRVALAAGGLSEASVKIHSGNAKTLVAEAVRRKLLEENPFAALGSGATAAKNKVYVTPEMAQRIIAECPHPGYRMLFALARYAGLRCTSESRVLTWADVDWQRSRLRVKSPKTERYAGHAERIVPIVPALLAILQAAFDAAEPGADAVCGTVSSGTAHTYLRGIIRAAGYEPWPDLLQTLRRSCEIEWALSYPQFAVSRWIGHSITVSGRHYANMIPDSLYERAAKSSAAPAIAPHGVPHE